MRISIGLSAILFALVICHATAADKSTPKAAPTTDPSAVKKLKATEWTVPLIDLAMRRIDAGTFTMGSPAGELARKTDEAQHKVTISKPFYMAIYETRQREYYPLMIRRDYDLEAWGYQRGPLHEGAAWTYRSLMNGRRISGGSAYPKIARTDLNPMECVTWDRAMEFCGKLTAIERAAGRLPNGYVYRLPTEAEWEYACRAGTTTPYNFKGDYSNVGVLSAYMCLSKDGGYKAFATSPTPDNRQPNAWGLYDMHGNVFEWCLDWYGPYPSGATTDPVGSKTGSERVARGGGVMPFPPGSASLDKLVHPHFRSAARYRFPARTAHQINLGFRIVLAPEVKTPGAAKPSK
ncbi:MAG: formylglycine-generating enzyme family protein [Phycisphaerae bacterium]|jgi:formylglycine-generating enzyme required for sulfatase activity|nr:formylglycine-generating enzyme family protein [Phycisphaerae bacterium]MDP7289781.1 formylglycine-generating enzyme family protein [Phycisphaerae bacterium]